MRYRFRGGHATEVHYRYFCLPSLWEINTNAYILVSEEEIYCFFSYVNKLPIKFALRHWGKLVAGKHPPSHSIPSARQTKCYSTEGSSYLAITLRYLNQLIVTISVPLLVKELKNSHFC